MKSKSRVQDRLLYFYSSCSVFSRDDVPTSQVGSLFCDGRASSRSTSLSEWSAVVISNFRGYRTREERGKDRAVRDIYLSGHLRGDVIGMTNVTRAGTVWPDSRLSPENPEPIKDPEPSTSSSRVWLLYSIINTTQLLIITI